MTRFLRSSISQCSGVKEDFFGVQSPSVREWKNNSSELRSEWKSCLGRQDSFWATRDKISLEFKIPVFGSERRFVHSPSVREWKKIFLELRSQWKVVWGDKILSGQPVTRFLWSSGFGSGRRFFLELTSGKLSGVGFPGRQDFFGKLSVVEFFLGNP